MNPRRAKHKPLRLPPKVWLGKRLTCTEGDYLWANTGKHHQLILQQYSDGHWYACAMYGYLSARAEGDTEWLARKAVERKLLWYAQQLGKLKLKHVRALPPVYT